MNDVEEIKKIIEKEMKPEIIVLFGSRARGSARRYSDYDFLIISEFPERAGEVEEKIFKKLRKQAHIVSLSLSEFKKSLLSFNPLLTRIFIEGKALKGKEIFEKLRQLYFHIHRNKERVIIFKNLKVTWKKKQKFGLKMQSQT